MFVDPQKEFNVKLHDLIKLIKALYRLVRSAAYL